MKRPTNYQKVNDLSSSPLRTKFANKEFKAETNFAVAMGRVSIKKNKEKGNSDLAQHEDLRDYAEDNKLDVQRWWDVAETASKHERRKSFFEMIEFVEESQKTDRPIKHVLFAYTSRGSRNKKSKRMIEELIELGVAVHFPKDNLILNNASDMADWLHWQVKSIKDEEDIVRLRQHIWDGTIKRLEDGLFPGKAPLGYRNYRPSENEQSIIIIDENAAPYIVRTFELWATAQYSIAALIKELEREFSPTRLKGRRPSLKYMEKLLRNPFYYGEFDYSGNRYKGIHEPLISFDLWKRAQEAFKKRGWSKECVKVGKAYSRLIKCGGRILDQNGMETDEVCGAALTHSKKKGRYDLWHCSNTTRRCSHKNAEFMKMQGLKVYMKQSVLEDLMADIFKPLNFPLETGKWMQQLLLEQHEAARQEHALKLKSLQERVRMLDGYIDQAYEDKLNGKIPESVWRPRNERWLQEQESLGREMGSMRGEKQDYIENGVLLIELCQQAGMTYKNADPAIKRKMVDIVSWNLVLRNGSLQFDYRKPFDILAKCDSPEKWWRRRELNPGPQVIHDKALHT